MFERHGPFDRSFTNILCWYGFWVKMISFTECDTIIYVFEFVTCIANLLKMLHIHTMSLKMNIACSGSSISTSSLLM